MSSEIWQISWVKYIGNVVILQEEIVTGPNRLLLLWAKKREDPESRYPLLCHMLDTAMVTREMWDTTLHSGFKRFFSDQLNLNEEETGLWLSFCTGLHDLGKASPGFQSKSEIIKQELGRRGFKLTDRDPGHGLVTARLLSDYLMDFTTPSLARQIAISLGGHHGLFPRSEEINSVATGSGLWVETQRQVYEQYTKLITKQTKHLSSVEPAPAFFMCLAGLTSVADWIASNETLFPYDVRHNIEDHCEYARQKAREALTKLGWTGWRPPSSPTEFQSLFQFDEIRPLQEEIIRLTKKLEERPGLVIIEAPMGEGKTEAAMYLADIWAWSCSQKGSYFALPTMATSDQMFGRVKDFLANRYHDRRVNLMLLHGHASLSAEFEALQERENLDFNVQNVEGERGYDGSSAGVVAADWFTYRKRGLLAPFGVGTVDQILLAVLQTRHVFVRLFGLASKTVIIDEVHAYDAYMTTLLERLLEWLAALGSSVVLLSATLPRQRRDALLKAYLKGFTKKDVDIPSEVSEKKYPRIAWTTDNEVDARTIATSPQFTKTLNVEWIDGQVSNDNGNFKLGTQLKETLSQGGCAAVICSTVDQAQKVYKALKPYFPGKDTGDGDPELDLLHARYLYKDRKLREERALLRFGKKEAKVKCYNGVERVVNRPKRAVLVATQVIEQSLDIDFDLMVTEMAPIDLILQRSGRMHRHQDRERPDRLKEPNVWICQPEMKEGVPSFGGGTEAVYDYHVLLRSWLAIKDRSTIKIPEEVAVLIEEVYGEQECPAHLSEAIREKWVESRKKLESAIEKEKEEAKERWIKWPGYSQEICRISSEPREENNPELHKAHQALTRLTGLAVNVLCFYGEKAQPYLDTALSRPIDTAVRPGTELTKELLMRAVTISRHGLVERIIADGQCLPSAWREEALLRHHYILFFDENNRCQFDKYVLILDEEKGLVIEKTV